MPTTDPAESVSWITELVRDGGGWAALLLFLLLAARALWQGGTAFMQLAREFSSGTLHELGAIKSAMQGHSSAVHEMSSKLDAVQADLRALAKRAEREDTESDILKRNKNQP